MLNSGTQKIFRIHCQTHIFILYTHTHTETLNGLMQYIPKYGQRLSPVTSTKENRAALTEIPTLRKQNSLRRLLISPAPYMPNLYEEIFKEQNLCQILISFLRILL